MMPAEMVPSAVDSSPDGPTLRTLVIGLIPRLRTGQWPQFDMITLITTMLALANGPLNIQEILARLVRTCGDFGDRWITA